MSPMATTSAVSSPSSSMIHHIVNHLRNIFRCISFWNILILMNSSNDSFGSIFRFVYFDERMFMIYSLFADFTEVKILANAAFVSNTNDWACSTAVASHILMLNKEASKLISIQRFTKLFALHQFIKDLRCYFVELLHDQTL